MASRTTYHLGGYQLSAPEQNRAEQWDNVAGTYTRWDTAGSQVEQRALTSDEAQRLEAQDTADAVDVNRRSIEDRLGASLNGNSTYLALASPTAAQTRDQARDLTRQSSALIKIHLDLLADTTGT